MSRVTVLEIGQTICIHMTVVKTLNGDDKQEGGENGIILVSGI